MNRGQLFGHPVISTRYCSDLVQARTHKKKRINKKWRKRYGFKNVPWKKIVLFDGKIYGHPEVIERLIKEVADNE